MRRSLQTGAIVWAEVADANGIRKSRPAVIVTPPDQISEDSPLKVIAITSRLPAPLPPDHVLSPWHPRKHPRTGLNRPCAAVCSWATLVSSSDIQEIAGVVRGHVLLEILQKAAALLPPKPEPERGV